MCEYACCFTNVTIAPESLISALGEPTGTSFSSAAAGRGWNFLLLALVFNAVPVSRPEHNVRRVHTVRLEVASSTQVHSASSLCISICSHCVCNTPTVLAANAYKLQALSGLLCTLRVYPSKVYNQWSSNITYGLSIVLPEPVQAMYDSNLP